MVVIVVARPGQIVRQVQDTPHDLLLLLQRTPQTYSNLLQFPQLPSRSLHERIRRPTTLAPSPKSPAPLRARPVTRPSPLAGLTSPPAQYTTAACLPASANLAAGYIRGCIESHWDTTCESLCRLNGY